MKDNIFEKFGLCSFFVYSLMRYIGIRVKLHNLSSQFCPNILCTGSVGLFVYDIFWVFFTPVMVSVAKSFDAPIKLLFPRPRGIADEKTLFSMLGLGDIVLPGVFVALLLRYDDVHGKKSKYFYR